MMDRIAFLLFFTELQKSRFFSMKIHAAVDVKTGSRDVTAAFARKEGCGESDVPDFPESERNSLRQAFHFLRPVRLEEQFRFDDPGRDGIDRDSVRSCGSGKGAREGKNASFRRRIMNVSEERAAVGDDAADADDPPSG